MLANPFAEALKYKNCPNVIAKYVSKINQKALEEISSPQIVGPTDAPMPRFLQAKTRFINMAGVFELINASEMPAARRFKLWNSNNLLPRLCQEGEYSMKQDAPSHIVEGMNAVHAAANHGREAPWARDIHTLKLALVEKDRTIEGLTSNLFKMNNGLLHAFQTLNEARKETRDLAQRLVDIAQNAMAKSAAATTAAAASADQNAVTKPTDPRLMHGLAVCALGGDQYAFIRPQQRSLKRSLDRLDINESDVVFERDYVPNSINILNKVKNQLPKNKFKARHNKITLLRGLTREDLIAAVNAALSHQDS